MKSMRSLYKKLFHYVPDKRILAYFSMALSAAAVCSYMGAYWFLWQSIVSILVIPVYEKAMYDAIIVVILMILRGILNIASATCSHYLGFRLETNLRKNGLHKLLDASSSFFDHNSSGEIRKIIDDNAAETHKTVAHLIPDNVTAVMTPVLMFVLMFAIDYRLGILLILTTVIGVLQYRKMSGGTEFLSGYSAALQKMSAATVEYVRGMQIIKIFGVTVQYYKTLINSIKEYKQYVYQYSLSCKNPYIGFQVLFNVFYAFAVPAAVVFISYGEPAMLILAKIVFFAVFSGAVFTSFTSIMFTGQDILAARISGCNTGKLVFRHLIPNILPQFLVYVSTGVASSIIMVSSFAFLGLGLPSGTPEWGAMLNDARTALYSHPELLIYPGLCIFVTAAGFNLFGEALRDILMPEEDSL